MAPNPHRSVTTPKRGENGDEPRLLQGASAERNSTAPVQTPSPIPVKRQWPLSGPSRLETSTPHRQTQSSGATTIGSYCGLSSIPSQEQSVDGRSTPGINDQQPAVLHRFRHSYPQCGQDDSDTDRNKPFMVYKVRSRGYSSFSRASGSTLQQLPHIRHPSEDRVPLHVVNCEDKQSSDLFQGAKSNTEQPPKHVPDDKSSSSKSEVHVGCTDSSNMEKLGVANGSITPSESSSDPNTKANQLQKRLADSKRSSGKGAGEIGNTTSSGVRQRTKDSIAKTVVRLKMGRAERQVGPVQGSFFGHTISTSIGGSFGRNSRRHGREFVVTRRSGMKGSPAPKSTSGERDRTKSRDAVGHFSASDTRTESTRTPVTQRTTKTRQRESSLKNVPVNGDEEQTPHPKTHDHSNVDEIRPCSPAPESQSLSPDPPADPLPQTSSSADVDLEANNGPALRSHTIVPAATSTSQSRPWLSRIPSLSSLVRSDQQGQTASHFQRHPNRWYVGLYQWTTVQPSRSRPNQHGSEFARNQGIGVAPGHWLLRYILGAAYVAISMVMLYQVARRREEKIGFKCHELQTLIRLQINRTLADVCQGGMHSDGTSFAEDISTTSGGSSGCNWAAVFDYTVPEGYIQHHADNGEDICALAPLNPAVLLADSFVTLLFMAMACCGLAFLCHTLILLIFRPVLKRSGAYGSRTLLILILSQAFSVAAGSAAIVGICWGIIYA